ncbi:MAG: DUF3598 family protein [Xenococcaceae cyanobacterium]
MSSQWEYLLKNLGEWQGSFTRFSPQGEQLEDIPSVLSAEGRNNNQTIHLVLRRFPPSQPPYDQVVEYSSLGKEILCFENGAFSQGFLQWNPFSQFGAELSLIEGDRRLRLVQRFNREGHFDRLTLIREKLAGTNAAERPPLTLDQLLGEWQGEAVTMYPDLRPPDTYPTYLQLHCQDDNRLVQQLTFGTGTSTRTIASTATINGSILHFDRSDLPVQILLLPDGASSNCPLAIQAGHAFFLEIGWLVQPERRQRLIRSYNDQGEWVSLTLVKEHKIKSGG